MTDLPVLRSVALSKVSTGWVVLLLETQGNRVIGQELLSEAPEPIVVARLRFQFESLRLLLPEVDNGPARA